MESATKHHFVSGLCVVAVVLYCCFVLFFVVVFLSGGGGLVFSLFRVYSFETLDNLKII